MTVVLCSTVIILSSLTIPAFTVTKVAAQHSWTVEVVDSGNWTGGSNSIASDSLGHPHVSYRANKTLKYAYRDDIGWRTEQVELGGICPEVGTSIAVDSHDRPWIAYSGSWTANCWDYDVRLAHWDGTAWNNQTVNPSDVQAGYWPSLAIDAQDKPHVAYYSDVLNMTYKLTYAVWNGSSWDYQYVETTGWNGGVPGDIKLKLDTKEWPHIAYAARLGRDPRYVHWNGTGWLAETPDPSAVTQVESISLALDSNDFPWISYEDSLVNGIKCAHWDGTQWIVERASLPFETAEVTSIAVDSKDVPHMAYTPGFSGPPDFLYYTSRLGGTWVGETADPTTRVADLSLTMDSHDEPRIAYMRLSGPAEFDSELRYAYAPWVDTYPPVSRILPINPYWNGNPIQANATDESGVANVTLWYRFSGDNSTWGSWIQFSTLTSPPWEWSFTFPSGEGYYEYYSTAVDIVGNVEPPPATADAIEGYDITPPVSTALPISPYWHIAPSMVVNATATDSLSGVAGVTLLYSHAPLDNSTWSSWTPLGTKASPPWSWPFSFPDGEGHYKFHTIARDVAGNVEGAKTVAEAVAGHRPPPDYVPDYPFPSSRKTVGLSLTLSLSLNVRNVGGETGATTVLAFYNESNPSSPFLTVQVSPVPPGTASGPFSATWTSPATPCACRVMAKVDYGNDMDESNETNNEYAWEIDVVGGPFTSLIVGYPNYTSPATVTYVKSTTPLDLSVLDQSGLGIRNTTYRVDGGNWNNYTAMGTFFLAGEGAHTIEWWSLDWAGNTEQVDSMNLTVDDTPPATTIHQSDMQATTATVFSLTATDSGCGMNVTMYKIDGGDWITYSGGFTLPEGEHNISYYSNDMLNNTEREKWLVVTVQGQPPLPDVVVNYKPIVALIFAVILAVVGIWSSKRRPWKGGDGKTAVLKAFMVVSLPFVLAETVTGIASFVTGQLTIPPLLGIGAAVDLVILIGGIVWAVVWGTRNKRQVVNPSEYSQANALRNENSSNGSNQPVGRKADKNKHSPEHHSNENLDEHISRHDEQQNHAGHRSQ